MRQLLVAQRLIACHEQEEDPQPRDEYERAQQEDGDERAFQGRLVFLMHANSLPGYRIGLLVPIVEPAPMLYCDNYHLICTPDVDIP